MEKSCGAVVFKKQKDGIRYLLLHYDAGHWDFPKGNQEKNEKEEQTAAREIKEETGIEDIEFVDTVDNIVFGIFFTNKKSRAIPRERSAFLVLLSKNYQILTLSSGLR